jgi:hypothetical protein
MRTPLHLIAMLALTVVASGCGGFSVDFGNDNGLFVPPDVVTLVLFNDTNFDVDPRIIFDDDTGFFADAFPSEELVTGVLLPGEEVIFDFDCDELGLVRSDEPDQFVEDIVFRAFESRTLIRGEDFFCGDVVEFIFVGDGDFFGVLTAVNGVVLD